MGLAGAFAVLEACAIAACIAPSPPDPNASRDAAGDGAAGDGAAVDTMLPADASAGRDAVAHSDAEIGSDWGAGRDAGGGCQRGAAILPDVLRNARDLGGIELGGVGAVACGALYRAAAPTGLTPQGCDDFEQLGFRTIIDLRTESERRTSPDSDCATQHATMVLAPMPVPYSLSPENYLADLNEAAAIRAAFDRFGDPAAYPVFFHCVYGRDRTGVLAAVVLLTLGASRDAVMADYMLSANAGMRVYPDSLTAVLDDIERRGGIEAYLAETGVPAEDVAALRVKAIRRQ